MLDVFCDTDLSHNLATISGIDVLKQALVRRLRTGYLFYDRDYGFDLNDYINCTYTSEIESEIRTGIHTELAKDSRINNCTVKVSYNASEQAIYIAISVSSSYGAITLNGNINNSGVSF